MAALLSKFRISHLLAWLLLWVSLTVEAEIAIIVHPENPVQALSERDIKKLFLGRIRMFPGTTDAPIVVDQPAGTAVHSVFYSGFINMEPEKLKRYRASYLFSGQGMLPLTVDGALQVRDYVASHPGAIGYVNAEIVDDSVKVVFKVSDR